MAGKTEGHEVPPEVGKIDVPIPPEGLVYDYMFEVCVWLDLAFSRQNCFTVCIVCVAIAKGAGQVGAMAGPDKGQGDRPEHQETQ